MAKFVYSNINNNLRTLYGPSLVNFYYGAKGDVYGQVYLWIEFVDRFTKFYLFPKLSNPPTHIVALSIVVKNARFTVGDSPLPLSV